MRKYTNVKKVIALITMIGIIASILILNTKEVRAEENVLPSRYNVAEILENAGTPLVVKNQHSYGICVYMAKSTVIEAHVKYRKSQGKYNFITETPVYSVVALHEDNAAISVDQLNSIISEYFNGEITNEAELLATPDVAFEDGLVNKIRSEAKIKISTPDSKGASSGSVFNLTTAGQSVYKKWEDGTLKYYDYDFVREVSLEEVQNRRKQVKEFIMKNGAVSTGVNTYGMPQNDGEMVNGYRVCNSKERTTPAPEHEVTIIGWDDNFSKDNFTDRIKPSTDGAWIAQNSWGETWGDNGVFYISYEDIYAEESIRGITDIVPYQDVDRPTIEIERDKQNCTVRVKECKDAPYGEGIDESSFKYVIMDHNVPVELDDNLNWISFNRNDTISYPKGKYVYVKVSDRAGNQAKDETGSDDTDGVLYKLKSGKYGGELCKEDVVIEFYDFAARLMDTEPKDFVMKYYCDTITQEEFSQMETIDENKSHILTVNKNGKHHIYAVVYDENRDEENRGFEIDLWIEKEDNGGNDNKQDDGNDNEESKSGSNSENPEKKDDKSIADKVLPNTGSKCIVIFVIIGLSIYAIRSRNKYKRLYK